MNKHLIFIIVTVWLILTQILPPINIVFPFSHSLKYAIFIIVTLLLFPSLFVKRSVLAMIIFEVQLLICYFSGNAFFDTINSVTTDSLVMMSGLLMAEYAFCYDINYRFTRIIVITVVIANVIMTFLSIPQLLINPNIIRSESIRGEDSEFVWVIRYATIHGIPFLFAPLAFMCRKLFSIDRKSFFLWLFVTLAFFYIVLRSNAATSFLMSCLMIIIGLLFKFEVFDKKNTTRLILVGAIGTILMQPAVLVPIIDTTQRLLDPSGSLHGRLELVESSLIYGESEGDLAKREEKYETSTNLFFESPFIGTETPQNISKHTWIIDRLALFGIIFIIPLVMIFIFNIKLVYKKLHHTKVIYVCGVFCMILMLYLKNSFGHGTWLYGFAFLPLLCRYIDYVIKYRTKVCNKNRFL